MSKKGKIIGWTAGVLCGLVILMLAGVTLFLQWYALEAGGNERGKNIEASYDFMFEHYPFLRQWTDSLEKANALRDTFIQSSDGVRLHALYLYADTATANTAIAVHGYTDNAVRMLHIAYLYNHDLHYNVLVPDLRFAGLSGGNHIQMGWLDRFDVLQWMDVANGLFAPEGGQTDMVVHGISMGSATTMCVSGEAQPRVDFPRSVAIEPSPEMPITHLVHPRHGRRVCSHMDGRHALCRKKWHQGVLASTGGHTCRFLSEIS